MPTLIEKIEKTLDQNTLDILIEVQLGQLGSTEISFRQFSKNARAEIKSFISDLRNIPTPDNIHAQTLETTFSQILATFPEQFSGVSVELSDKSKEIIQHIEDAYLSPLSEFFELYRCIDELLLKFQGIGFAGNSKPSETAPFASANLMLSQSLKEGLDELLAALNDIESPLTGVESLIVLMGVVLSFVPREYFSTTQSPFIDDIQYLLETINEWYSTSDASQLADKILESLTNRNNFLDTCLDELEPLITAADEAASELAGIYSTHNVNPEILAITAGLDQLAIAVSSKNLEDIRKVITGKEEVTDLVDNGLVENTENLKDKFQIISDEFTSSEAADQLAISMEALLLVFEEKMIYVFSQLKPTFELDVIQLFPETFPAKEIDLELDSILEVIRKGLDWLCALLHKLNLQNISNEFASATTNLNHKLEDWADLKDQFYADINSKITGLEKEIKEIDIAQLQTDILAQIETFKKGIQSEIEWIFSKVETSIDDFIILAESTAGDYSYEDLEQDLQDLMQSLSGALMEYLERLDKLKATMDKIVAQLQAQSFKSVSDLVIAQIDKTTTDLDGLDPEQMNPGVLLSLTVALEVLPKEELLRKQMDQLQEELEELIAQGPIALIEKVKDKPAELVEKILAKSPYPLIKEKLDEAYQKVKAALEEFTPGQLLNPIAAKLAEIDDRLAEMDNPCQALDPVVTLYDKLLAALDRFDAEAVLEALQKQKDNMRAAVEGVQPEPYIDALIERLEAIEEVPQKLAELLKKLSQLTARFDDPEAQLDDCLALLYDKIDGLDTVPDFEAELAALIEQSTTTTNSFLEREIALTTKMTTLIGLVQIVENGDQLTNFLLAYNNVLMSPIDELPKDERIMVKEFLVDFSPFATTITTNLEAFQGIAEQLRVYEEKLTDWQTIFFGPNSPLAPCIPNDTDLKEIIKDCIETQFKPPLLALLSFLPEVKIFADEVKGLLDTFITDCLPDISGLSEGLEDINSTLDTVKNSLLVLDISPAYNLEALYQTTKDSLRELDLSDLQTATCQAFDDLLNSLKISELLSTNDIESLDDSYANLLEVVHTFDPVTWVEAELEPELERLLKPYLDSFDLSKFFEMILEKLEDLQQELREELDRIYEEFVEMLEAVPRIQSPVSLTLSI